MLLLYTNGSETPTTSTSLSGTLANNSVIVYRNGLATIYGGETTSNAAVSFNGNDALALWKVSTSSYVDIFGCIGEDPGTAWTSGSYTTFKKTLVRKSSVIGGVTENPESGFPTLSTEWDLYDEDDVSNLGSHTFDWGGNTLEITTQPISFCRRVGENVTFSVATTDSPTYQWYWLNGSTWEQIAGENTSSLSITGITADMDGNQYFCEVSDGDCTLKSNTVQLTIVPTGSISIAGSDAACDGDIIDLHIGYERPGYIFTISILLDGIEEQSYNQDNVPSGNPFTYTTQPLVWDGPGVSNQRVYSVKVTNQHFGCESDEADDTATVFKIPETGPQYHIPNTFGQ